MRQHDLPALPFGLIQDAQLLFKRLKRVEVIGHDPVAGEVRGGRQQVGREEHLVIDQHAQMAGGVAGREDEIDSRRDQAGRIDQLQTGPDGFNVDRPDAFEREFIWFKRGLPFGAAHIGGRGRKVVDAARKRKPPSGKNEDQKKQDQDKSGQQQDSQDQGKQEQQDPGEKPKDGKDDPKQGQGKPQPEQQGQQPSPSQKPGEQKDQQQKSEQQKAEDAKAQQAADAAQRERMQQAMQQGKPGEKSEQQAAQAAAPQETAEQREKRQAVEAWLKRVPDEPGGLLKNKFRLEYERRQKEGK